MIRRLAAALAAFLAVAVLAAGCGSSSTKTVTVSPSGSGAQTDTGQTAAPESEAKTPCKAAATTKSTGLPGAFPIPGELTITAVAKQGPTVVDDGYWAAALDEVYREFKDQITAAHYAVLFTENEHRDAEISYKGSGRSGQIALKADCTEAGLTRVHITNRPA